MGRARVARNQRARLYGAMIESVARSGYQKTTVADVIGLAGVSRRTFYEHFSDKDACLLATHNSIVARARMKAIEGWGSQHGWSNRLHAACKSLFDDIVEHPKAARLVLVDSLGVPVRARAHVRISSQAFERLLQTASQPRPGGADLPWITPSAIVGGVRHAVFVRAREHREPELVTLADEVLDWVEAYRLPREPPTAFPAHGSVAVQPHGLTPAFAARGSVAVKPRRPAFLAETDPRTRMLNAAIRLTLEGGYARLTDSRLAKSARVPTQAFHRHFRSKEDCLIATLDAFAGEAREWAYDQLNGDLPWPIRVHRAIDAYVHYLAVHRDLTRLAFVDAFDLGNASVGLLAKAVEGLVGSMAEAGPPPHRGPLVAGEAITGAIWTILFSHAINSRFEQLPATADQIAFIALAPHIGAKAAGEAIREGAASRGKLG
jgi:AcrR family transcriptional regulator